MIPAKMITTIEKVILIAVSSKSDTRFRQRHPRIQEELSESS